MTPLCLAASDPETGRAERFDLNFQDYPSIGAANHKDLTKVSTSTASATANLLDKTGSSGLLAKQNTSTDVSRKEIGSALTASKPVQKETLENLTGRNSNITNSTIPGSSSSSASSAAATASSTGNLGKSSATATESRATRDARVDERRRARDGREGDGDGDPRGEDGQNADVCRCPRARGDV